MNKVKKLVVMLISVACVCAFAATSAFALDVDSAKKQVKDALAGYGVTGLDSMVDNLSETQLSIINDEQASLQSLADDTIAQISRNPENASAIIETMKTSVEKKLGLSINAKNVTVSVSGDKVTVGNVKVNGYTATVPAPVDKPAAATPATPATTTNPTTTNPSTAANSTWTAQSGTVAAASATALTASSASVIKATGDSTAVPFVAAVMAIVAVLGLAVRKNASLNV